MQWECNYRNYKKDLSYDWRRKLKFDKWIGSKRYWSLLSIIESETNCNICIFEEKRDKSRDQGNINA